MSDAKQVDNPRTVIEMGLLVLCAGISKANDDGRPFVRHWNIQSENLEAFLTDWLSWNNKVPPIAAPSINFVATP